MRSLLSLTALLALGASACSVETGDEPLGAAAQAEIDPGTKDYVIYTLIDTNANLLASVLVTATAGGGYSADREYWYVTTNISNTSGFTLVGGTSQYWSTPPSGLGTLSFTMARTPTWVSGSHVGSLPAYINANTGEYEAVNWQMTESGGVWSGNVTWWKGSSTGNLFGPSVTRTLAPTSLSGSHYYFDNTPL